MSSTLAQFFLSANQETNKIMGLIVFIGGVIGQILNILIFQSLKTFRETSCVFYLTVASTVDLVQIISAVLPRILSGNAQADYTTLVPTLCKIRFYLTINCGIIWFTCMCSAAIDQFLSLTDRWRHLSHIRVAYWVVFILAVFWSIIDIPVALFSDTNVSAVSNQSTCAIRNPSFTIFYSQFLIPIVHGFIPILIRVIFGLLSFLRVRSLANREVPIIRSRRDKQLTAMVLIEVVVDIFLMVPFIIYCIYFYNTVTLDPVSSVRNQFLLSLTLLLFYSSGAASFYIYCCSSSRFRHQLVYVLIKIPLRRCEQRLNRVQANRIIPKSTQGHGKPSIVEDIELRLP